MHTAFRRSCLTLQITRLNPSHGSVYSQAVIYCPENAVTCRYTWTWKLTCPVVPSNVYTHGIFVTIHTSFSYENHFLKADCTVSHCSARSSFVPHSHWRIGGALRCERCGCAAYALLQCKPHLITFLPRELWVVHVFSLVPRHLGVSEPMSKTGYSGSIVKCGKFWLLLLLFHR